MKKLVLEFLGKYCTKVRKKESISYVELMMDNHKCVEFDGKEYYVPEDVAYNEDEQIIYDYLIYVCHV
jgi:hypothetical protein